MVSVGAKVADVILGQVSIRKTNESKPIDDASLRIQDVVKTRGGVTLLGQVRREPDDWAGGDRRKGGVNSDAGFCAELQEPVAPDAKGEAQVAKTARREYRCGALGRTDP